MGGQNHEGNKQKEEQKFAKGRQEEEDLLPLVLLTITLLDSSASASSAILKPFAEARDGI